MSCFASFASGAIALVAVATAARADRVAVPPEHVTMRAVADTSAVEAGTSFDVAVVFEVDHGWHIYWENPGDAGLATTMKVTAPAGFTVGDVRYPGPVRFVSPGNIESYGYEGSAALFARVTAPAGWDGESVELAVKASWLACAENCIPGKGKTTVTLAKGTPAAANAKLLAPHRARLPRPLSELDGVAKKGNALLVPSADAEFFPTTDVAGIATARIGKLTRVKLPSGARGVLRAGAKYYHVNP
jgi:thiol:disulfide interchange protein DsbD